jgi:2-polyprenyl-6-methoxyphenol hydroxylase-like FAD-dependent oxidoreductase
MLATLLPSLKFAEMLSCENCPSPLSGPGTSLALVGAYVLVGELVAAGGDHRIAFRQYQQRMSAYVAQAQQLPGHGIKEFAPMTAFAIRMRAVSMRWITRWPLRTLVRGPFTKADAIELPAYEDVLVPTGGML